MSRRARALSLLGASAICAGLAASFVSGYERDVRARVGPLVPVLVARKEIQRGRTLTPRNASTYLAERSMPSRFAPPGSFGSAQEALGLRALVTISPGSYVDRAELRSPGVAARPQSSEAAGGRLVAVSVAGASALRESLRPGLRVDVLITSEHAAGSPRTYLAVQRVELVDFRTRADSGLSGRGENGGDALATLRVTLRQAVLLTAAQNFARELRLVPRAGGDDSRLTGVAVSAADLHP